jgi:hypothetical protein
LIKNLAEPLVSTYGQFPHFFKVKARHETGKASRRGRQQGRRTGEAVTINMAHVLKAKNENKA